MAEVSRAVLTLVRHGETSANVDGVWHGSTDTALTERGRVQAQRVAARMGERFADAALVYSSPLQRAHHTAQAIQDVLGCELRLEAGLREYDLGRWEGRTYRELQEQERFWHHIREDPHFAPHGGESPKQVAERLTSTLQRIASDHRGQRVVVVTHGGVVSMALGALLDGDYSRWHRVMENCALTELVLEPAAELLSFNQTDHLGDLP